MLLVGFMAGLVGWTVVVMAAVLGQGPVTMARLPSLPPALQVVAFAGPAVMMGHWLLAALGSSQRQRAMADLELCSRLKRVSHGRKDEGLIIKGGNECRY